MSYEYGSESKLLELPNPYQLQNRLLWLCAALLVAAGVVSLLWARSAIEQSELRLAGAPLLAGLLLLGAGLVAGGDGGDAAALLLRPRPAGVARARDSRRRERRLARGHRDQGDPAPGRPHLPGAAGRRRRRALPLGADLDHRAARGAAAGAALHVQPGGDRGDAAQLRVLVVRVRQRGDAALDRHPLLRLRRRLPDPAGALAAQGARDDGVARRPRRRRHPRPGGDRPDRAQAAAARRVLARHPDLRHARHRPRRVRAGDGGDPRAGRRGAADARQRRAGAAVDERAAVDADGRARSRHAVGVDRAHSQSPLRPHRAGDDGVDAGRQLRRRAVRGEPAAADLRHQGADRRARRWRRRATAPCSCSTSTPPCWCSPRSA